jgi:hypothetical protein
MATLNRANVPPTLLHLAPLAERWGIGDDLDRDKLVSEASLDELRELTQCIDDAADDALRDWLAGKESIAQLQARST